MCSGTRSVQGLGVTFNPSGEQECSLGVLLGVLGMAESWGNGVSKVILPQ